MSSAKPSHITSLLRGDLSDRLAATLNKPAKRSRFDETPGVDVRVFYWTGAPDMEAPDEQQNRIKILASGNPACPRRHVPFSVRRNLGGDLPDVRLRLSKRRGSRTGIQGRQAAIYLFALRQPDAEHVRRATGAARRDGILRRDSQRHVRRVCCAGIPTQGR